MGLWFLFSACNILVQDTEGAYTLDNHGRDMNCSLTTLFDAKIRMMYVNVGQHGAKVKYSTGIQKDLLHKVIGCWSILLVLQYIWLVHVCVAVCLCTILSVFMWHCALKNHTAHL